MLIICVVGGFWARSRPEPLSSFDQPFYLGIAFDIRHFDRFTNGFVFADPQPDGSRPPGMRFAPLYPWLIALAAATDPGFAEATDCVVRTRADGTPCSNQATLVRVLQAGLLAGFFVCVWLMARASLRHPASAWFALVLALTNTPLLTRYVDLAMTEITALFLFTLASTAALAALVGRRPAIGWLAAGSLLGLAALTRPAFLYLCLISGGLGLVIGLRASPRARSLRLAGLFGLGMVGTIGPWILRNAVVVGYPALTHGYDSHTLVQRISFDQMNWREYGLSYLCWLPDGQGMGSLLFGPHTCDRFGWETPPDTFYAIGTGELMRRTVAEAGGWDNHLSYLLHHYVLADPLKHALVTIPLTLRGAWINHYWGFCLFPVCLALTVNGLARRQWAFPLVALPALFMLVLNAAVAVNQVRYNLVLIPAYSLAGAMALEGFFARRRPLSGSRAQTAGAREASTPPS